MESKLVSVIVPAYNTKAYIGRAIESLLSQSYRNIEILVIDDGSSDGTGEEAEKYAKIDNRIKVISKENGGVSRARNTGIEQAEGEFVAFLDSDDEMESYGLEKLVEAIVRSEADLVNCNYSRWDESGTRLEDYDLITGEIPVASMEERLDFVARELLPYRVGYEVWDKLYRAYIIKKCGITFDPGCSVGEDLAFNLKYITKTSKIACIPDRCIKYTIRQGSAMGSSKALSKRLLENGLLIKGFSDYITRDDNKVFIAGLPIVLVKTMESAYIGHTPEEILKAYTEINDSKAVTYIRDIYKDLNKKKDEIIAFCDKI